MDFLPREVVSYSKETQTPLATHQSEGELCLLFTSRVISGEIARVTSFLLISCPTITDLHRMQTVTRQRLKGSFGSDFDNCGEGTQWYSSKEPREFIADDLVRSHFVKLCKEGDDHQKVM